jgi:sec-independent protein translocase protein TatA
MFGFGGPELWIVLVIVLVLFGGAKVPQLMKGLGEGMKEFKKATKDEDETPVTTTRVVEHRTVEKPIETHSEPRV